MKFLGIPVVLLASVIFYFMINKITLKEEVSMDEANFIVRQSKIYFWLGFVCMLLFGGLMIILGIAQAPPLIFYLIFSFFIFLGLFTSLYCVYWKLEITGNNINFTVFTKHKSFSFKDITTIKLDSNYAIKAYLGKRKCFTVETNCVGYKILFTRLQKENIPIREK